MIYNKININRDTLRRKLKNYHKLLRTPLIIEAEKITNNDLVVINMYIVKSELHSNDSYTLSDLSKSICREV
jgi:hypothetical protein